MPAYDRDIIINCNYEYKQSWYVVSIKICLITFEYQVWIKNILDVTLTPNLDKFILVKLKTKNESLGIW